MYRRLTYLSNRAPGLTDEQLLERVVRPARVRNLQAGVTSCLWADAKCFFQLLEGPEPAVTGLLDRISTDPRHSGMRVVSSDAADGLVFQGEPLKLVVPCSGRTEAVERTVRELVDLIERGGPSSEPRPAVGGAGTAGEAKRVPLVVHVLTRLTCAQGI